MILAVLAALVAALLVVAPTATTIQPAAAAPSAKVFVFTGGQKPPAVKSAVAAIRDLGKANGFQVVANGDASQFSEENLAKFSTVVFLTAPGDVLDATQEAAFESWYRAGGGWVGLGASIETEPDWDFLTEVIGARATEATGVQAGTVKVADRGHVASADLPDYWTRSESWYNFDTNVRGSSHVLATVVELVDALGAHELLSDGTRLDGIEGGTMGADHPVAWCKDWQGGRSFYSALGTTSGSFADADFRSHVAGAITWASGLADPVYSDCGATVMANFQQTKIAAPPNIGEPIGFDVLPDGRVLQTQRSGALVLHDPEANTTTTLAQIPVYTASEDGLYGPAIDADFDENGWVYLYYSPPTVEDVTLSTGEVVTQTTPTGNAPNTAASIEAWDPWVGYFQLSRFKFVDGSGSTPAHLDVDSEEQILRVPVNRGACCHVAGDIDFDLDGNLWMVTGDDTPAGGGGSGGFGPFNDQLTAGGQYNAPHVDARRSALNTNDLRGKLLRITVKDGAIADAEENDLGGAYSVPDDNLFQVGDERARPEIYAMGLRNPFRVQVDSEGVAYIADYSPDSRVPEVNRGPAGTGRVVIIDEPANYGWPVCYKTDLPYFRWNFVTSSPLDDPAQPFDCDDPDQGPMNESRWVAEGGPSVEPGRVQTPPITDPEVWYSYNDNAGANPLGTPCFASYDGTRPAEERVCPRLFPGLESGGVGPQAATTYEFDPDNTDETRLPPYYDGAVLFGEFTRDHLKEIRFDSQGRVSVINDFLDCGALGSADTAEFGFECDTPMDFQFDEDGHFYLLTYGDGFFRANPDAGLYRWDYVKGTRAPTAVLTATPTDGQAPLAVQFSSEGSNDADPADSIRFAWDFDGNGTVDSVEPNPTHTYTTNGVYVARLTVTDSSGKTGTANTTITVGNTSPTLQVDVPVEGGTFTFGESIPFQVSGSDAEDGPLDCSRVQVTVVLAHDEHGHAGDTTFGCSGTLSTDPDDESHGGNVWAVVSASYTDAGGPGGIPALSATDQANIRQKLQQVEFVLNQSSTNVATTNDPDGGGEHRTGLNDGAWMQLNGGYDLVGIDGITLRVSDNANNLVAGAPLAAVEIHLDAPDGPILDTVQLTATGGTGTWESQSFPLADPGGLHDLYLVARAVPGGATGNNLFRLNWVRFDGAGIAIP
ncbi:ThuA domain-containing protein [Salsipaludibacter albus]|uniref:ThuA domain-containing protein n=1 Tax=Salsipaludibacter albus TaxID=2849650 RepID=UPI001EE460BB|nr:ThuA domain-containing protein [Salsipaludibacter albus]